MKTLRARLTVAVALTAAIPAAHAMAQSAARPALTAPASPVAEALRGELARGSGAAERAFYQGRAYAPLWLASDGGPTPSAEALLDWADAAEAHALPEARYGLPRLRERLGEARAAPADARLELDLTRLFLSHARALSSGLLVPGNVTREIDVAPVLREPGALLRQAATSPDLAAFLDGLAPSDPDYARLLGLYQQIREIVRDGGWGPEIPGGPTLRLGDRAPRVAQVRQRLIALGDLPETEQVASNEVMNDASPAGGDPMLLDAGLEAAVLRFQARHGLNMDGAVGPMTLAALNTPAEKRAEQVAVALERERWLNRDMGERHVFINLAGFSMSLIENGAERFTTRTVIGKASRHRTPEFIDSLEYIVVNPAWNVPRSIATEEILPELRKDPTYLQQNNMELVGADLPATMVDWSEITRGSFPWRIRQRPGPGNALGTVKFLFPNKYSIYMHDTPAKRLFQKDRRDFSHGCIRLEQPTEFAHLLLSYQSADPAGMFDRLRSMPGERWVTLEEPIPVYVSYRTAWVDEGGTWQFRSDIYHRDEQVAAALREAGVPLVGG